MNPIFTKLLQNESNFRPFIQWFNTKYPNTIALFQNLPFSHQLGVYLEYFEELYSLSIIVSRYGYVINFKDDRKVPLYNENNFTYNHHKFSYEEPKSIMYAYELGIQWLFENYDLPF